MGFAGSCLISGIPPLLGGLEPLEVAVLADGTGGGFVSNSGRLWS